MLYDELYHAFTPIICLKNFRIYLNMPYASVNLLPGYVGKDIYACSFLGFGLGFLKVNDFFSKTYLEWGEGK